MEAVLVNADLPSLSPVPPLGLLSLAQVAESHGHRVEIRDYQLAEAEGSREPETFARFCDTDTPVLGVSCSSMSLPLVLLAMRTFKQRRRGVTVVLGGIGVSAFPRRIVKNFPWIDYVVVGEGERPFSDLLDNLQQCSAEVSIEGVIGASNLMHGGSGRHRRLIRPPILADVMRSHIDLQKYKLINVHTARGCPYPCTFCDVAPYWDRKYVARPVDDVVTEIMAILDLVDHNPTIVFVDDTLTINERRVIQLCDALAGIQPPIEWACYVRADKINRRLAARMSNAGCRKVYLGLESGSDRVLSIVKKGFNAETGRKAALLSNDYFPIVQTSFIWGFPFETWDDFYESLLLMAWLVSHGVAVKANLFTPLPFASFCRENRPNIRFRPEYSPQLLLAGYDKYPRIVDLITQHPTLFCGFYYWEGRTVIEKYNKLRTMKFSPEHIWDIWESNKAPVPIRELRI